MSLRPLATAMIMVLFAAPAHADLIIDRQDGQQPTVVSDAAIARGLSAGTATPRQGLPSNLHLDGPSTAPAPQATLVVPRASAMQAQVVQSRPLPQPVSSRVFETGSARPSNANAPVKGWADDIPLDLALQQVVPQGWSVSAAPSTRSYLSRPVSWSGGRPWVEVLSSMVSRLPVSARVDWDSQQVLLFDHGDLIPSSLAIPGALLVKGRPAQPAPLQVAVQPTPVPAVVAIPAPVQQAPATPVRQAHHQQPVIVQPAPVAAAPCCAPALVVASPSPPPQPVSQRWLIDPRLTLRENVEAWTKQAGWNSVVWEAADYEMVAPAQFQGSFTSAEGPLAQLIQAYADSDQPLKVRLLTQDKVVHVTNRNYIQTVVDPASPSSIAPSAFSR